MHQLSYITQWYTISSFRSIIWHLFQNLWTRTYSLSLALDVLKKFRLKIAWNIYIGKPVNYIRFKKKNWVLHLKTWCAHSIWICLHVLCCGYNWHGNACKWICSRQLTKWLLHRRHKHLVNSDLWPVYTWQPYSWWHRASPCQSRSQYHYSN